MDLRQYFADTKGVGVFSTADGTGKVNSAIYAKPHMRDDGYLSFIMRKRLTRNNLQQNPHAHYLFLETGDGYSGIRIYLEKVKEVEDAELVASLSRRKDSSGSEEKDSPRVLVSFKIVKIIELLGDKEISLD